MAEDPYAAPQDAATAANAPEGPVDGGPEDDTEDEEDAGPSCLVPKSVLGEDLKPGATVTVTVLHVFGDEYEVGPEKSGEAAIEKEEPAFAQMNRMSRPRMGGE